MDNQLQSVSKIFIQRLYRIPDYQRGYAWTEKQLKDFWNDIIQLEDGKNHYVGVLTLEKVPPEICKSWSDDAWIMKSKNYEPYYVVDGQQRLTTTIILTQAITEAITAQTELNYETVDEIKKRYIFDSKDKGISRSYIFGYEKDNPSYEFLKTKIFLENSPSGYLKEETIYTHNLILAKEYFQSALKKLKHNEIENIYKKVTQNLLFNIYSITSDIDVFIAFETMNNRGKPLSNLELLKNRLIYLSTKFKTDEHDKIQLRKRINDSWKAVYHYLGRNKEKILDDDFFLMNHCMVYFGNEELIESDSEFHKFAHVKSYFRDNYEQFLLENKFNLKNLLSNQVTKSKLKITDINNYVESLESSVRIWFSLYNTTISKDYDDDEKILLEKLDRIGFDHFSPFLLACYIRKPSKSMRIKLLTTLERYAFFRIFTQYRYRNPFGDITLMALDVSKGAVSISTAEKRIASSMNDVLSDINFMKDLASKFAHDNFYHWEGIRYFLYEYDLFLKGTSKAKKIKIDWNVFKDELEDYVTVEHIYPQKPNKKCWNVHFADLTLRQRKILANSLGNLLPLSKPKNSSLQNNCFETKIDNNQNQVGYRYGSYSENEISKLNEWTPKNILERGIKLLTFLEKRWDIPLGNDDAKIKILGLDFLKKK